MFGKRKASKKTTAKKETTVTKKVTKPAVEEKVTPSVQGLSGRELNRKVRGVDVKKRHARGRF